MTLQFGAISVYPRVGIRDAIEQQIADPGRDVIGLGVERLDSPVKQNFGIADIPYFLLTQDEAAETELADLRHLLQSADVELISRSPDTAAGHGHVEGVRRQLAEAGANGKRLLLRVYSFASGEPGTYLLKDAAVETFLSLAARGGFKAEAGLHYLA